MKVHAIRLAPGEDLKKSISEFVKNKHIKAGVVLTCVGSLAAVNLRFANKKEHTKLEGKHEILSLAGTVSVNGLHLHICVSDGNGNVTGGHLIDDCLIFTTAEIVIAELPSLIFQRKIDQSTGFKELFISEA